MNRRTPIKVVLALGWYFPESTGGTEVYVASLGTHLKDMGYEPVVIAPFAGEDRQSYEHDHIAVFRYPIPSDPTREEAQELVPPRYFSSYLGLLKKLRPEIVHFHTLSWPLGIHHVKAAREMGCRVVVTAHTPSLGYLCPRGTGMIWGRNVCDGRVKPTRCSACLMQQKGIPSILGRAMSFILWASRHLIPRFKARSRIGTLLGLPNFVSQRLWRQSELFANVDMFITLTETGKKILLENGAPEKKVLLCRLAISQEIKNIRHKARGRKLTVGYVGRMDPIKGLDVLIRAFQRLPRGCPIQLKIYSVSNPQDPYYSFIKSMTRDDERIELYSQVQAEKIPEIFCEIDVLAVPSLCMEGGPTVLLEAFACKVPVIGSNIGAIPEYIQNGKNGLIFEPGDLEGIEDTLRSLLADDRLLPKLIEGIGPVSTMKEVALTMGNLYSELVGNHEKNLSCQ